MIGSRKLVLRPMGRPPRNSWSACCSCLSGLTMITEAHRVLKCRHYSLYDIRVDANEQPYILEAALFCSFSPLSVIPAMAQHSGREDLKHPNFFHSLLERVTAENHEVLKPESLKPESKADP